MSEFTTIKKMRELSGCDAGLQAAIDVGKSIGYYDANATIESELEKPLLFTKALEIAQGTLGTYTPSLLDWLISRKADLLEYTNGEIVGYKIGEIEYETLEEAITQQKKLKDDAIEFHANLTTINVAIPNDIGEEWKIMCVYTCADEYKNNKFYVFNHRTGENIPVNGAEEARLLRESLIESAVSEQGHPLPIYKKMLYAEDGVSTKFVLLD